MAMRKGKRAFIFSFAALFISIIIFSYAQLELSQKTYTQDLTFKESRILFLNDEVKYFKEIYVVDSLKFSMYHALDVLLNHTHSTGYSLQRNHSRLNEDLHELMANGSINGIDKPAMDNKTFQYFMQRFKQTFEDTYRGNITGSLDQLNVFQDSPYYLSFQAEYSFEVTTQDNISSWDDEHTALATIPILELKDPQFLLLNDLNLRIRPAERYLLSMQWDLDKFNKTINNTYSTVYVDPNYHYTLGDSYLDRFLNRSESTYDTTLSFLSFDYDEANRSMVDTSLRTNPQHFGNTQLLMTFDNGTIQGSTVDDISDYGNDGQLMGAPACGEAGVSKEACRYDGSNDGIRVADMDIPDNLSGFSFSVWIHPDTTIPADADATILRMNDGPYFTGTGPKDGFAFRYNGSTEDLEFIVGNTTGLDTLTIGNVSANEWTHLAGTFSGNNLSLFRDGDLLVQKETDLGEIRFQNKTLQIGSWNGGDYFAGMIDELSIHAGALSEDEITDSYINRRAELAGYQSSYLGESLRFDGRNDYINLSGGNLSASRFTDDWSIELWFTPREHNRSQYLFMKQQPVHLRLAANDSLMVGLFSGGSWQEYELQKNVTLAQTHYVALTWDQSAGIFGGYVNDEHKVDLSGFTLTTNTDHPPTLGAWVQHTLPGSPATRHFKGNIDEFRMTNETLDPATISNHYHNFGGYVKGCCGYITPINPSVMGYDSTAYDKDVSYTSRSFYQYHKRGRPYQNVTLYGITNITSNTTSEPHYNLKLDYCAMRAYQVFDYDLNPTLFAGRNGTNTCLELISSGYY